MNFKRGKPKSARSGCLLCKPWKRNGCARKGKRREERRIARELENEVPSSA